MAHLLIVDIAAPAALASMHVLRALCPEKIGSLVSKERKYWMPLPVIDGKRSTTLSFTTDTTAVSVRRYAPIRRFHEISLFLRFNDLIYRDTQFGEFLEKKCKEMNTS